MTCLLSLKSARFLPSIFPCEVVSRFNLLMFRDAKMHRSQNALQVASIINMCFSCEYEYDVNRCVPSFGTLY